MPDKAEASQFTPGERLQSRTRKAYRAVGVFVVVITLMAQVVQVTGAVVAGGALTVESQVKSVSHLRGGVLSEVLVHDGSRVRAGDVLLRLDNAVTSVNADLTGASVAELRARRARLEAEIGNQSTIAFPQDMLASRDASVATALERERRLFDIRQSERASQIALLEERVTQARSEIDSTRKQIWAIREQEKLISPELGSLRQLYGEKLVTINRLNEIERTAVSLSGEAASLEARVAQITARISEIREQMLSLKQGSRADAGTELAQVIEALNQGEVRSADARDMYERSVIRAPQDGVVYGLAYTTPGSAVPPGQQILQIVPDGDRFIVDARVSPSDIDQLQLNQKARLRFPAFNAQTTPEADAVLTFIAPERAADDKTGASFYHVKLSFDRSRFEKQTGLKLTVGMPAEVFISTGDRSLLSYLTKPFFDQLERAFRD
ncbi:HlyD family type I secretion periplasmic adaptor subunit [Novosphingobium jiangmenense]|uniref:Membrane fusion protein (MFP) family protein n=1 Tax=Novosphingobium jiangmenense TaxID=2791981 RepID=A0ABS0HBL7_9SPHN|nr:HlyD family type I secretion periplasmic adaptor subunit [Novosphingobium jiangmenense]MBF9149674.1 HlyD family type I secretion periplasmic adaptor subunit [Novosphingobium jiangmenense]